jgi:hypothetical protein
MSLRSSSAFVAASLQALPSSSAIPNVTDSGLVDMDSRIIYCPEKSSAQHGHTLSKTLLKTHNLKNVTFYIHKTCK